MPPDRLEDVGANGSKMAVAESNEDPDDALVARIAGGDERAFTEIVRRHAGRLRTLALRFGGETGEADDIVQETFWTVWRKAGSWQPGGPPFAEADAVADEAATAEDETAARGELAAVAADIRALPQRQRAAILLAAGGEHSNSEIAAMLGLSAGAVEQLLVRARRTLRARLAEREG